MTYTPTIEDGFDEVLDAWYNPCPDTLDEILEDFEFELLTHPYEVSLYEFYVLGLREYLLEH